MIPGFIILIAAAYLLGSIPFGLLIARAHGIDLRKIGSGNIGATNVSRALGKKWAYICFALDALKGLVPMLLAVGFGLVEKNASVGQLGLWLAVGCAAILGHVFPIYLGFRGGKGVATSMGVVMGLWPYYTLSGLIVLGVWIIAMWLWRYVSLASLLAAVLFPVILTVLICLISEWRFENLWPLYIAATGIPLLVIARHAENIKRLLEGSEPKVGGK
ncbi:MAG: glycerol-3-phosphate 1-O-acyltransferase PlsY [Planctomycetes bacterium]|nr:glycerol-3-phosphate 1-O-acyltransferase PlsY [Planctomycetota bacterium]